MRDDFPLSVKRVLAERVNYRCCHPGCRAQTTAPHTDTDKRVSVGVAAHITAASPDGPRYDASLTELQRRSPENGIWMCQTDGTLVDTDAERFPVTLLREWKAQAEAEALHAIGRAASPNAVGLRTDDPDISVIFAWEKYARDGQRPFTSDGVAPPTFDIVNYGPGHASEIQVHDIVGGSLLAKFPFISDLAPNEHVQRHPEVTDPELDTGTLWRTLNQKTIEDLLESADRHREHSRLQEVIRETEPLTEEQMDAILDELATRIDIEFRVTYWNRQHTRQWEKRERLCFEPHEHRAYVLHGQPIEIGS